MPLFAAPAGRLLAFNELLQGRQDPPTLLLQSAQPAMLHTAQADDLLQGLHDNPPRIPCNYFYAALDISEFALEQAAAAVAE